MIRKIFLATMIALMLTMAGCTDNQPTEPKQPPADIQTEQPKDNSETKSPKDVKPPSKPVSEQPKTTTAQEQTVNIKVYFPDDAGLNLVSVERQIKYSNDEQKYETAVKTLMETPKEKGLITIFPKNAKLNSVKVKDGTAFVDFDKNLAENFVGGSTGEEFLVDSVVDTLTEFNEVKQVRFLIDGQEIETLSGHMDLSVPVKRRG